jgi:peptidoglycan hydrolase CwlO-like protein
VIDQTTLIWVLVAIVSVLVVMNIALILIFKRKKEVVPDTLPPLSEAYKEKNLKVILQQDIDKKQARIAEIKATAKELEGEMLKLKDSIKELEAMRGDVI